MTDSAAENSPQQAVAALNLMVRAMALLDQVETDIEVAGHLDFAISRLRQSLSLKRDIKPGEETPE